MLSVKKMSSNKPGNEESDSEDSGRVSCGMKYEPTGLCNSFMENLRRKYKVSVVLFVKGLFYYIFYFIFIFLL